MTLRLYALTMALVATTIVADYFLKLASERPSWLTSRSFAAGVAVYGLSAIGWVLAMQQMKLATIAVTYSAMTMLMLAGLGVIVFRETLTPREGLGLALALASMLLMYRPH